MKQFFNRKPKTGQIRPVETAPAESAPLATQNAEQQPPKRVREIGGGRGGRLRRGLLPAALFMLIAIGCWCIAAFQAIIEIPAGIPEPTDGVAIETLSGGGTLLVEPGLTAQMLVSAFTIGDPAVPTGQSSEILKVGIRETDCSFTVSRETETDRILVHFADGRTLEPGRTSMLRMLFGSDPLKDLFLPDTAGVINVAGVPLEANGGAVQSLPLFGEANTVEISGETAVLETVQIRASAPSVEGLDSGDSFAVCDAAGTVIAEGPIEALADFRAPGDGVYTFTFCRNTESGTLQYAIRIPYVFQPVFRISADTVQSGGTLVLVVESTGGEIPQATQTAADYTPVFLKNGEDTAYALIPIPCSAEAGDYSVTVSCGGFSETFGYTVTPYAYTEQHLVVSEETTTATRGEDAIDEYNRTLNPLYGVYSDTVYFDGPFLWPVEGTVTTEYGLMRFTNDNPVPSRHTGIDIAAAEGTPVRMPAGGTVLYAGYLTTSGYTVFVDHGAGVHSLFLHMSALHCETGDVLTQGDILGAVGMTGYATGPHLHYTLMIGSYSINPMLAFDGSTTICSLAAQLQPTA